MDILTEGGALLVQRDYTLLIEKSELMAQIIKTYDEKKSLWLVIKEATIAIATECEKFDFDGFTVYLYATEFERFDHATVNDIVHLFQQVSPSGKALLASPLKNAIERYFSRRLMGFTKPNGETIVVFMASAPDDPEAIKQTLINASNKLYRDEELAILFVQIVKDDQISAFLHTLDDDLQKMGAKFDICDAITLHDIKPSMISEVLLQAIAD